ncbi:MAG: DNA-binding protein [Candidatus Raymondbacteria bacterium RifOxyA12_full_50_37]|uniref:DNA-binding protein n=1 Tax=Candidatus Raymondbacteria bacterium RIFOXYD12_FULL_49_13 TaxID=1817890 RepID=A0A1F7FAM4_UNCRA|nr:MAG: DNA-binding protein [Candidatus Raymondbacteria bacterium RifOxyA12_full_50_37]OGJ92598.1 MAG: DNA-binding protein [Candidatus Raymondbacteria bacterium RIFOXYA2_FULL_49_16]OGJ92705.1 MAG: DNA-binding protein [Candidatus Raymondbacteria bacterium RifOxyB12_full_50_8]OGJ97952.1 MAG: DNA-binding protein [Candidatus Raymondbacteria bacterium RIFOXYC2_FULL_50_21]OGK02050.1 MAG: DNA-binding protein [Candidatus Raymondbacteria bacterium RifOxyC12_full_50_8]OGK03734.1 MAG: DNA-binding protein
MTTKNIMKVDTIHNRIYSIRGVQAMLDTDLAVLYKTEVKTLNRAVKRNLERFPDLFMFQLTTDEYDSLRSQFVTIEKANSLRFQSGTLNKRGRHRKYLPYAFTEQGVAMLSAVLRSQTAVKVSIQIINAFIVMRKFIAANAQVFQRLNTVERKQLEHKQDSDEKFKKIFNAIEAKEIKPKQGVFYNGQVFDAWQFISSLVRSAKKSIALIDNYVDDRVLALFAKRNKGVTVAIFTKNISRQLVSDAVKFNEQYPPIVLKEFGISHDRFLILDETELYHFGASLKDLGKRWFAFSKMDINAMDMLERLKKVNL